MVYLVIKELSNTAEDVIMVTSSIMKDTAMGSDVVYRANAIRALCRIIDVCWLYLDQLAPSSLTSYRPPPYKPSSATSRRPLSTRHLQYPRPPSFHPITSSQSPVILSDDGRARLKRLLHRQSRPVASPSASVQALTTWQLPTQTS